MSEGRIHIYYGDGKGKTTSSLGLIARALGWGKKVAVFFFLKPVKSGEMKFFSQIPGVKIYSYNQRHPLFWKKSEEKKEWKRLLLEVKRALKDVDMAVQENYDLIVLDEILNLLDLGLITREYIIEILKSKSKKTEIVFTGRHCPRYLRKYAHYISEINAIKNPYYRGVKARRGIEY